MNGLIHAELVRATMQDLERHLEESASVAARDAGARPAQLRSRLGRLRVRRPRI